MTVIKTTSSIIARIELDKSNSIAIYESSLPFTIGRGTDCDLCIADNHVSRHHCELSRINDVLFLKDTSANGTIIGDRLITQESVSIDGKTSISLGGAIQIGLTPLVSGGERADTSDRRACERRQITDRRANVVTVDFNRREIERRDSPRRELSRRTAASA